ncbi:hypothetical protein FQZ97_1069150 [compost metagenome]
MSGHRSGTDVGDRSLINESQHNQANDTEQHREGCCFQRRCVFDKAPCAHHVRGPCNAAGQNDRITGGHFQSPKHLDIPSGDHQAYAQQAQHETDGTPAINALAFKQSRKEHGPQRRGRQYQCAVDGGGGLQAKECREVERSKSKQAQADKSRQIVLQRAQAQLAGQTENKCE